MTSVTVGLDFELCRQILFRLEEIIIRRHNAKPYDFQFDGYSTEYVDWNVQKLHEANLVTVRTSLNWHRGQLRNWPVGFHRLGGEKVLMAAKDEETWQATLKAMESQSGPPTLKKLKAILFAIAREDA